MLSFVYSRRLWFSIDIETYRRMCVSVSETFAFTNSQIVSEYLTDTYAPCFEYLFVFDVSFGFFFFFSLFFLSILPSTFIFRRTIFVFFILISAGRVLAFLDSSRIYICMYLYLYLYKDLCAHPTCVWNCSSFCVYLSGQNLTASLPNSISLHRVPQCFLSAAMFISIFVNLSWKNIAHFVY